MAKSKEPKEVTVPATEVETVEHVLKTAKVLAGKKGTYSMFIEFDRVVTKPGGEVITTPVTEQPPKTPHEDLFKALRLMVPHWAIDAEFKSAKDFNNAYFVENRALEDKTLEKYKVTGVYVKEKKGNVHVVLIGRKILSTGKVINHSPMFDIDSEDGVVFSEHLKKAVENFLNEVGLYREGKVAPKAQLEAFPEPTHDSKGEGVKMKVA